MSVSLLLIAVTVYTLILAVTVCLKTRRHRFGRLFAWFLFWTAGWTACTAIIVHPDSDKSVALVFSRATFFCATCFAILGLWFCTAFPYFSRRYAWISLLLSILGLPWLAICWTPAIVIDMTAQPWAEHAATGHLFPLFGIWIMCTSAVSMAYLVGKLQYTRGVERLQLIYILIGLLGMWIGGATCNLFLPYFTHSTAYAASGPLSSLFISTAASYAILRYRLLDIRIVLRYGVIYALTIGVLTVVYAVLLTVLSRILAHYFVFPYAATGILLSFCIAALFHPLLQGIQRIVNRSLFKTIDYRQTLRETSQALASVRATPPIIDILTDAIVKVLHPLHIVIFLPNSTGAIERVNLAGSWDLLPGILPDSVFNFAVEQDKVLITDALLAATGEEREIGSRLRSWGADIVLPLLAGKQLCGLMFLGEKRDGSLYTPDDAGLLRILSKQAAMALDNAHHYEALRRANMQLEERVHERTQQLAIVNDQLANANAALEAERAYLAAAIDILPIPLLFRAPNETVIRRNVAFNAIFSTVHMPEAEGAKLCDPNTHMPLPLHDWPGIRALRGEVISACEKVLVMPDGREIPVLAHAGPIYVGDEIVAAVVAFQDISALKAADKAKDEFLAVLSHELKTPLTCILAWAEVARFDTDPAIIEKSLTIIKHNALRQRHLLNDLLDVSRIIHQKLLLHPEPTDLWQLARQAVEELEQTARERKITLLLAPPGADLPILADPARIAQVITNILNNALKFTEAEGRVTITGTRTGSAAVLTVSDTGRGIPPEQLPELFQPFRQVERIEANGGLGLGLALVKGLTELHGGTITASSPGPNQGSTFTLMLPLASPDQSARAPLLTAEAPAAV